MAKGLELAVAYVSLAVSAEGVGAQVAKQLGQVDGIARKAGERAGKALKHGVESQTPDLSGFERSVESAKKAATTASKAVAAERHKEAQATSLVTQRQKELTAVVDKYGVDSAQASGKARQLADAQYKAGVAASKVESAQLELVEATEKAGKASAALTAEEKRAETQAGKSSSAIGRLAARIKSVDTSGLKAALNAVDWDSVQRNSAAVAVGVGAAFVGAGKMAADFEQRMSAVKAVSGATAPQLQALADKAKQLGKDTSFSASESAVAIEELVKAGISVPDVMNGAADATVALAAASGMGLADSATIAANAMNAFKMEASDVPRVADLIAGASNASAIDAAEFGQSLQQAGAVANLAGLSFDDLSVAIAELGNAGIKGSDAGTSLKTMFQRLQPQTQAQMNEFQKLGLLLPETTKMMKLLRDHGVKPLGTDAAVLEDQVRALAAKLSGTKVGSSAANKEFTKLAVSTGALANQFYDAEGKLKPLSQIQDVLGDSLKGMTEQQKQATLQTLFGSDAIRAAAILSEEGAAGYDKMATAMGKVTAESTAADRMGNLNGKIEEMKGAFETLAITLGTRFIPIVTSAAVGIGEMVDGFLEMPQWQQTMWFGIAAGIGATAAALAGGIQVAKGVSSVLALADAFRKVGVATDLTTAALLRQKVASVAASIATAAQTAVTWLLNSALFANPIGIVILAIIALVGALVLAYQKSETFRNIVNGAFAKIAEGARWLWENGIKPAFAAIAGVAVWLWNTVLKPAFFGMINAFRAVGNVIRAVWVGFISPIFQLIGAIITLLYVVTVKPIFQAIGLLFRALGATFMWVWKYLIKPPIDLLIAIIRFLWDKVGRPIFDKIKERFRQMGEGLRWVWNHLVKPVFDIIADRARTIGDAFKWGVGMIKKHWDKIKEIAKAPVKFVLETVINKGLIGDPSGKRGGFNALAKLFGTDPMAQIKLPPGFQSGSGGRGVVPGVFNPAHRDNVLALTSQGWPIARVEPGEAITNRQATARSSRLLGAINSGAISDSTLPGFRSGGVAPVPGRSNPHPHSQYPWTTFAGDFPVASGTPIRAWKDGIVAAARYLTRSYGIHAKVNHDDGTGSLYAHMRSMFVKSGQRVSAGQTIGEVGSTGNSSGPHLHFETTGGQYNPFAGASTSGSAQGSGFDPMSMLMEKFAGPLGRLKELGNSPFGKAVAGMPRKIADVMKEKASSLLGVFSSPGGAGVERWRGTVEQALGMVGLPKTPPYIEAWLRQIKSESGGNPSIRQGITDVNSGGNEAQGLVQVIPGTFAAYRSKALPNDRNNPLANLFAGMNYAKSRYGAASMLNVIGHGHGYLNGTLSASPGIHAVSEDGRPELVVGGQLRDFGKGGQRVYNANETERLLAGGGGPPEFHIWIGDKEVTDLVRVEYDRRDKLSQRRVSMAGIGG